MHVCVIASTYAYMYACSVSHVFSVCKRAVACWDKCVCVCACVLACVRVCVAFVSGAYIVCVCMFLYVCCS